MPILEIRPLRNPPIDEAVVDLRVRNPATLQVERFLELQASLASDFPIIRQVRTREAVFDLRGQGVPTAKATEPPLHGVFYLSSDEKLIAQFRRDGFTLNRLRPYVGWNNLAPTALALWSKYLEIAQPESLVRVALRYINRFPISSSDFLERHLQVLPGVPDGAPRVFEGFAGQVRLFDADRGIHTSLVSVLETGHAEGQSRVILDIDVFRQDDSGIRFEAVQGMLDELRELKNQVFFSTLTEEAIGRFA